MATPVPPSAASTIDKDEMLSLLRQASSAALSGGQRTQLINWLKAGAVSVKTLSLSQDNVGRFDPFVQNHSNIPPPVNVDAWYD